MATHPPLYLYLYLYLYNDKYNDNDDNDSASSFCLLGTICLRTSGHLTATEVCTQCTMKGAQLCIYTIYTIYCEGCAIVFNLKCARIVHSHTAHFAHMFTGQ